MPKPRILLVDDEERFRANLEKMLGAQGLTVSARGSGAEALEELKHNAYDVIVLDIRMPGMDGLATLRRDQADRPGGGGDHLKRPRLHGRGHGDQPAWGATITS